MRLVLDGLSGLLIPLTVLSYVPQWLQLYTARTTGGISLPAVLLLALSAQAQMATMYFLFACPASKRDGLIVSKPPSSRDYINLAQLLGQWICSLLLLALTFRAHSWSLEEDSGDGVSPATPTSSDAGISARTATALLVGHATLCVALALFVGIPTDDWLDLQFVIIMSINDVVINPLITAATVVAFVLQIRQSRTTHEATTLNTTTLFLQALIFTALGITWVFRFTMPDNLVYPDPLWILKEWYPHVGWAAVNNAIIGVGQYLVLYAESTASRGSIEL